MSRQLLLWPTVMLIILLSYAPPGAAQSGGTLAYDSSVYGTLSAENPLLSYTFNGTAGDLVHIEALGLSSGFDPVVNVLAPDQQMIANSSRDGLAVFPRDVHIALYLPQTGTYSIVLGGVDDSTGDFLLELNGHGPASGTPLTFGERMPVTVAQNAPPQYFVFDAAECPTSLVVFEPSAGQPYTFPFIVKVRDPRGQTVALLRGGDVLEDRVIVEPLSGTYEVEVWADDPALAGQLALLVTCGDAAPACVSADTVPAAGGEVSGASGGDSGAVECPLCPSCPGEAEEDPAQCANFQITLNALAENVVEFSWPEVDGATVYRVGVYHQDGRLVYGRQAEGTTSTLDFALWDITEPDTFTIIVSAAVEGENVTLCTTTTTVEFQPACMVQIETPRETVVNGLQTFTWTPVAGEVEEGVTYWLRFGITDNVLVDDRVAAPEHSLTLDVSAGAIGGGAGPEGNEFNVQLLVLRQGRTVWCFDGFSVTREP